MSNATNTSTSLVPPDYLKVTDGQVITTSLNIADVFGKRHTHVINAIKDIEVPNELLGQPIFRPSNYKNSQGKMQPMYEITRDGFTFLVMGFTGKKAAKFKWAYIAAFNLMEKRLLEQQAKALPAPALTPSFYYPQIEATSIAGFFP